MTENELSHAIIGAAIEVHETLGGPGLLEDIYEEALAYELKIRQIAVARQVGCDLKYKDKRLQKRLVIDLVVNGKVIVECKATEKHNTVYEAQVLTYLRLTGLKLGMVINFGQATIKGNIKRVVNNL